jgi:lipoprotein-anchoring transpeptidase ErfK/SrfK
MTPYDSPYAARFVAAYEVATAREIFAWTEAHPITAGAEWPVDVYRHTGDPNEHQFILAVPTPEGLVGFFAPSAEDAERIRASVF